MRNLPNDLLIVDELKHEAKHFSREKEHSKKKVTAVFYLQRHVAICPAYCNQSHDRQDVVEGIPENSPPGQHHHLRIQVIVEFLSLFCVIHTIKSAFDI